ncbi:MAG: hypothetical protein ACREDR_34790 [Blastocatellia bacterium]
MIRRCISSAMIAVCLLGAAAAARAQERTAEPEETVLKTRVSPVEDPTNYDDDGGRVFLVTRDRMRPLADLRDHGGRVIGTPTEYTILLGTGWSKPWNKARAAQLPDNVASVVSRLLQSADGSVLASHGVANISQQPNWRQDPISLDDSESAISDLRVQAALSESFARGAIGTPNQDTIYTVFLPPGATSTIGGLLGGKHYLAYHNFFHIDGVQINYVVVPFQGNERLAGSVVRRALIEAILNPSGDGWF